MVPRWLPQATDKGTLYARNEVEGWQRVQMSVRPSVLEAWGSYAISRFAVARGAPVERPARSAARR
eukprot:352437-Chlamydomonas_euryale.AAC.4